MDVDALYIDTPDGVIDIFLILHCGYPVRLLESATIHFYNLVSQKPRWSLSGYIRKLTSRLQVIKWSITPQIIGGHKTRSENELKADRFEVSHLR
jgi:hypothetical protein